MLVRAAPDTRSRPPATHAAAVSDADTASGASAVNQAVATRHQMWIQTAMVTLLLIGGGLGLTRYVLDRVDEGFAQVDVQLAELRQDTNVRFAQMDGRLTSIESMLADLNGRTSQLEEAVQRIDATLAAIVERLAALEQKVAALAERQARTEGVLEGLAHRVDALTGR